MEVPLPVWILIRPGDRHATWVTFYRLDIDSGGWGRSRWRVEVLVGTQKAFDALGTYVIDVALETVTSTDFEGKNSGDNPVNALPEFYFYWICRREYV